MEDLKPGTKLNLIDGGSITISSKIGEGGQGSVYRVVDDGKEYALKWYHPMYLKRLKNRKQFCSNLSDNINKGSPSPAFLWPKAIACTGKHSKGIGYVMDIRPTSFCEFTNFMKAKERFTNTRAVINAAINVVDGFQALHREGLSYQDLSPGNFFIDKNTGEVLICDNDNVAPCGTNMGVGGTPGYMAPEVILGKAKPDTNTDLFSLSVILFELFFLAHPLEGANCYKHPCLTPKIEREIYAEHPVFVCSKTDKSNAPVRGTCSNLMKLWTVYPEFLHEAFGHAFGDGLKDPNKRLSEYGWKNVLYRLLDNAITCNKCHDIVFAVNGKDGLVTCDVCGQKKRIPVALCVNDFEIVADKDKVVTEHHISHNSASIKVGTILESKKTPGVYGLRNDSGRIWEVTYPGQSATTYAIGKTVTLMLGTEIKIGNVNVIVKNRLATI